MLRLSRHRWKLIVATLIAGSALVFTACGSSEPGPKATPTPQIAGTDSSPLLHLSVGIFTTNKWRSTVEFLLKPAPQRLNCTAFLQGSDRDTWNTFEMKARTINSQTPKLTPVAGDEARAGAIIRQICLSYPDVTPPAGFTPPADYTPPSGTPTPFDEPTRSP